MVDITKIAHNVFKLLCLVANVRAALPSDVVLPRLYGITFCEYRIYPNIQHSVIPSAASSELVQVQ